jgi:hypothetical protein
MMRYPDYADKVYIIRVKPVITTYLCFSLQNLGADGMYLSRVIFVLW